LFPGICATTSSIICLGSGLSINLMQTHWGTPLTLMIGPVGREIGGGIGIVVGIVVEIGDECSAHLAWSLQSVYSVASVFSPIVPSFVPLRL
jgi:hypothetical protein